MTLPQTTPEIPWWRRKRFWRLAGAGAGLLVAAYLLLFFLGKNSPHYQPDPTIEGRLLSAWTKDIKGFDPPPSEVARYKAVEILRANKPLVTPALIGWLDERDSFPEAVYFFTTQSADGFLQTAPGTSNYWGAHQNHSMAACAFRAVGDRDATVIAALRRTEAYYTGKRYFVMEDIHNALQELSN